MNITDLQSQEEAREMYDLAHKLGIQIMDDIIAPALTEHAQDATYPASSTFVTTILGELVSNVNLLLLTHFHVPPKGYSAGWASMLKMAGVWCAIKSPEYMLILERVLKEATSPSVSPAPESGGGDTNHPRTNEPVAPGQRPDETYMQAQDRRSREILGRLSADDGSEPPKRKDPFKPKGEN